MTNLKKHAIILCILSTILFITSCSDSSNPTESEGNGSNSTPYMELVTTKNIGETIRFGFAQNDLCMSNVIWIDLNNDNTVNSDELVTTYRDIEYTVLSKKFRIYGKVSTLSCLNGMLTNLDTSHNTYLKELKCGGNNLSELDLTNNLQLKYLQCQNNNLSSLSLTKNTNLTELWCAGNLLTKLNLNKNLQLEKLSCLRNELSSLELSNNPLLRELNCNENQLTKLDVSNSPKLTHLSCTSNQIDKIVVSPEQYDNIPVNWTKDKDTVYSTN